jgi:hypothetical protein
MSSSYFRIIRAAVLTIVGGLLGINSAGATLFTIQELSALPGYNKAFATAINASGPVVGYSSGPVVNSPLSAINAVLWSGGTVKNLSPGLHPSVGELTVANDINDLGQIVGLGAVCDSPGCVPNPSSNGLGFVGTIPLELGSGGVGWIADPSSGVPVPLMSHCNLDGAAFRISDTGYVWGTSGGLVSPKGNAGAFHEQQLCGVSGITHLYENGVVVTSLGLLFDPLVHQLFLDAAHQMPWDILDTPAWVLVPSCASSGSARLFEGGSFFVGDDIKAEVCDLAANGFERNRQQNASGQFIINFGNQAFLITPIPEPATLFLVAIGLFMLLGHKQPTRSPYKPDASGRNTIARFPAVNDQWKRRIF